jgi:hypothetical protein
VDRVGDWPPPSGFYVALPDITSALAYGVAVSL